MEAYGHGKQNYSGSLCDDFKRKLKIFEECCQPGYHSAWMYLLIETKPSLPRLHLLEAHLYLEGRYSSAAPPEKYLFGLPKISTTLHFIV